MKCTKCSHEATELHTIRVPQYEGVHVFHEPQRGLCYMCVHDAIFTSNSSQMLRHRAGLERVAVQVLVRVPVIVGGDGSWTTYKTCSSLLGQSYDKPDEFSSRMRWITDNCAETSMPLPSVVTLEAWVSLPLDSIVDAEVEPSEQPRKQLWRQECDK
jgi:hypothetical protein